MSSNLNQLTQDLTCPITLELFEDPITVPCCGKCFSRLSLVQYLNTNYQKKCPLCNGDLSSFDALNVAKNTVISSMIDTITSSSNSNTNNKSDQQNKNQTWSAVLTNMYDKHKKLLPISELKLFLEHSAFTSKPSLFIAVVDQSGSMSGNPWNQVKTALTHITAMARGNQSIKVVIIAYHSVAQVIKFNIESEQDTHRVISGLIAGGGTNFSAAFQKIKEILSSYTYLEDGNNNYDDNCVGSVNIAFLTDGDDNGSPNKATLGEDFKYMLHDIWSGPSCVHSIGFSANCNMKLLEELSNAGSLEGTIRYAEPNDASDTLCSKLQSLFDMATKSSTVAVKLELDKLSFKINNSFDQSLDVQFPVDKYNKGVYAFWVKTNSVTDMGSIIINSFLDENVVVPITLTNKINPYLLNKWFSSSIDDIARELLDIVKHKSNISPNILDFHCALILQKINALLVSVNDTVVIETLNCLNDQVNNLRNGFAVNIGKLNDMKYSSKFTVSSINIKQNTTNNCYPSPQNQTIIPKIDNVIGKKEFHVFYCRNNTNKQRNSLQEAIMNNEFNKITSAISYELDNSTIDEINHKDVDGNNTLHLAAYCGQSFVVDEILKRYPNLDLDVENIDGETATTLAIKKRGFWKVLNVLLYHDAKIPQNRKKGLEQYVLNRGLTSTAQIISNYGDPSVDVNYDMTPDYVRFQYNKAINKGVNFDVQSYLDVCLSKHMKDMIIKLVNDHSARFTIEMVMNHCLPKKPDCPDTELYIDLVKLVFNYDKSLINCVDINGDTLLIKACEKGSLPHVKLFLEMAKNEHLDILDRKNLLGNTALWISCMKGYPCIISELLDHNADVNSINLKGNPPMYSVCQKGPKKVAELLLSRGATVEHVNTNGDTLPLICCRNGQHEILELLLNYVDGEFVDFKAHIDGFNTIFASTEANRPECIRVLYNYGVDLNQKTDDTNSILAGATPLHLASYYGRQEACNMLLSLNCDVDSVDINKQTPLHIAVIQGNISIIKHLVGSGANIMIKDIWGNTPVSYCRNRVEIRKLLTNPALECLMNLAKGQFTNDEEKIALELLINTGGLIGCLSKREVVDVSNYDSTTPLMQAIIHSNYNTVKTLLDMDANPHMMNTYGLNSIVWAHLIKNPRIIKLLDKYTNKTTMDYVNKCLERIKNASKISSHDAMILFPGQSKPKIILPLVSSGIDSRMEYYINIITNDETLCLEKILDMNMSNVILKSSNSTSSSESMNKSLISVTKVFDNDEFQEINHQNLVWNAKIFTINNVASTDLPKDITPQHVMALALYTNNNVLFKCINNTLINFAANTSNSNIPNIMSYIQYIYDGLQKLNPYIGEVFIGANTVNRAQFKVGSTICFSTFLSSSSMWRVATEHVKEYDTNKKQGTIFIVKSKSGKYIGQYSQFSFDAEVIFLPYTKFMVTNWYRGGDYIVLGQENIREHTYKIKEEDIFNMMTCNKSMVIELQEL